MIALPLALLAQAAAVPAPSVAAARTYHGAPVAADEGPGLDHLLAAERMRTDRAAAVVQLDAALAALPHPTPLRWATQCIRSLYPVPDAPAAADKCLAHFPGRPEVLTQRAVTAFAAGESGTGARLMATVLRAHPELGDRFPAATVDGWLRQLDYDRLAGERATLVAALAASRYGAADPSARATVLREAALDRLAQADVTGAQALADQILDPFDLLTMLVDRRFAPLWSAIAVSAGPGLESARERFVAASRAAYEAQPDAGSRRMLAGVLTRTGHADEALALLRVTLAEPAGPQRDDWYRGAATVSAAKLIARQTPGRQPGDVDTILAPMRTELPGAHLEQNYIVPNLALAQIALDRPGDAIATMDRYPLTDMESPAAEAFVLAIRACALHRLGRDGDAAPLLARIADEFASNAQAGRIATQCTGDAGTRARAWIARAQDPRQRSEALVAMVRARQVADPTADPLDPDRGALRAIAGRRDVGQAFAALGRMPGPGYAAAVAEWRAAR